jgi:hypothetical protein
MHELMARHLTNRRRAPAGPPVSAAAWT